PSPAGFANGSCFSHTPAAPRRASELPSPRRRILDRKKTKGTRTSPSPILNHYRHLGKRI
ncbi:hypothetical protein MCOR13_011913, partial [Pyricularia oryzae]